VSKKEAINRALQIACQSQTGRTGMLFGLSCRQAEKAPRKRQG
jgi:hypothetical protein